MPVITIRIVMDNVKRVKNDFCKRIKFIKLDSCATSVCAFVQETKQGSVGSLRCGTRPKLEEALEQIDSSATFHEVVYLADMTEGQHNIWLC